MRVIVVHLSDLHLRAGANLIASRTRHLASAITSADPTCRNYAVVLSGDIANAGLPEEYEAAKRFLDELSQQLLTHSPGSIIRYLAVPGNHDCYLPEPEINLRSALVKALTEILQNDPPDQSIMDSVLGAQNAYADFAAHLGSKANGVQRLCSFLLLEFPGVRIGFALYNTALLSTRNEQQGSLAVPLPPTRTVIPTDLDTDATVSVFHHPYPWLQADNGIAFREHIEHTSEIVLTGHQHFEHTYMKSPLPGDTILYSEGDVLQDSKAPLRSGFRLIQLDTDALQRRLVLYQWNGSIFSPSINAEWHMYKRPLAASNRLIATAKFSDYLSDSGIGLFHPAKGSVPLDAVYVYPDVATSALSNLDTQIDVKGSSVLSYLNDHPRVIICGGAYSGKTSLAKSIARDWLRTRACYSLLIRGDQIKKAGNNYVEQLLKSIASKTYEESSLEHYHQLQTSLKALVIDDWDECTLSNSERDKFLHTAEGYFGRIVLLVSGMSHIDYILAKLDGSEAVLKYDLVTIKDLSHVARGELIDNWLALGMARDDKQFHIKAEETQRLVQSVIGKNTLPSIPFFVLAILQASERTNELLPENGSFGYLYEVLITNALNSTTPGEKPQLDKKYTFLSLLAYHLFDSNTELINEEKMESLLDDYSRDFKVKVEKEILLQDLERTHVLVKDDGNYSFGYTHYFYYFLARYFKNNIRGTQGPRLREVLDGILNGLNSGTNGIFRIFFVYLTHDEQLIDKCVSLGNQILADFSPADFTTEVQFYNAKDFAGIERQIPESVNFEQSRRQRRQHADEIEEQGPDRRADLVLEIKSEQYSDKLPVGTRMAYATSCIEILGQILRNFTGSLPGEQKLAILKTTYLLGLRLLKAILMSLNDAAVRAKDEIAKRDPSKAEDRQFINLVEKLITVVGQILGASMIQMISLSIGSPDIEESAYSETLTAVGPTAASNLIDLAIHLDHFESYPFNQIKKLYKDSETNRYAQLVLRDLVVANMYVFDLTREMRQRVLNVLESKKPNEGMLSQSGKRLKPDRSNRADARKQ